MLSTMDKNNSQNILTDDEANFCLLYVDAPAPLAGNATECYIKVFGVDGDGDALSRSKAAYQAKKLLEKEFVKKRIEELERVNLYDSATLKQRITTTMLKIMDECADSEYSDRYKTKLSPAALRSVAVSAAKMVADINGIKEDTVQKILLGSEDGNGITFNLVVPEKKNHSEESI